MCNVSTIFPATTMTASEGVMDGFVMYSCLKKTMSDTLLALIYITHRSRINNVPSMCLTPKILRSVGRRSCFYCFFSVDKHFYGNGEEWFGIVVMMTI